MTTIEMSGWVDRLEQAAIGMTDTALRETGMLHPPIVHILTEGLDPPYVGYLTCRPFYRGHDAHTAIALLGLLPALLGASHVMVAWENADLCTALEIDEPDGFPPGMVLVTADRHRHTRCWHPMRLHADQTNQHSGPRVVAEWGPVQRLPGGVLPDPITDLLTVWRAPQQWSATDQLGAYTALEGTGYLMRWVRRPVGPVGDGQPSWVRLFEPLMT